jgi:hypothetical protein
VDRSDPAQVANEPFNGMLQEKAKFLKRFLNHVREIERMEAAQPFSVRVFLDDVIDGSSRPGDRSLLLFKGSDYSRIIQWGDEAVFPALDYRLVLPAASSEKERGASSVATPPAVVPAVEEPVPPAPPVAAAPEEKKAEPTSYGYYQDLCNFAG